MSRKLTDIDDPNLQPKRQEGDGGGNPQPTGDDYTAAIKIVPNSYDYRRDLTEKDLLDANVQIELGNMAARKNLSNDLSRLGLENTGYAGTASAMLGNQRAAEMAEAQRTYQAAMAKIEQEERDSDETAMYARADNIISLLDGLDTTEQGTDYLTNQVGLVYDENTGKWTNGKETNFSDTALQYINEKYWAMGQTSTKQDFIAKLHSGENNYTTEDLNNFLDNVHITGGVKSNDKKYGITWEVMRLLSKYNASNPPRDGWVVKLQNGNSENYAIVKYVKGVGWVQTTAEEYERADPSMKEFIQEKR